MNIVMLDRNSLPSDQQINAFDQPHSWVEHAQTDSQDLVDRCAHADILVLSKVPIGSALLAKCPRIKHIAIAATGHNIVDLEACGKFGVSVSNVPSYAATTVAEHVINVTLSLRRQLNLYRQLVIDGAWQTSPAFCLFDKPVHDMHGATMGIIGLGEIGQKTATLANAMGMKVLFSARREGAQQKAHCEFATQVEFETLLAESDVISLHCSLNHSTRNLIGMTELKKMKPSAILINTARGGIVNEAELRDAILNHEIGGAAIDVMLSEPPTNEAPLLQIANRDNVIITPHMSWTSRQSLQVLVSILVDNINAFMVGRPQNLVN